MGSLHAARTSSATLLSQKPCPVLSTLWKPAQACSLQFQYSRPEHEENIARGVFVFPLHDYLQYSGLGAILDPNHRVPLKPSLINTNLLATSYAAERLATKWLSQSVGRQVNIQQQPHGKLHTRNALQEINATRQTNLQLTDLDVIGAVP